MGTVEELLVKVLRIVLLFRFALHALFVPAFEGPDEPFHLARIRLFLHGPAIQAIQGTPVDAAVTAAIRTSPCGPDLARAFDCPPFGREPGAFNLLRRGERSRAPGLEVANFQAHQPPLYYLAAAAFLLPFDRLGLTWPEIQLLLVRLLAVAGVAWALFGPVRRLGRTAPGWELIVLVALLLPGAAESLVRCANDVAVFVWACFLLDTLSRSGPSWRGVLLISVGPLLKLTAWPIAAFVAVRSWRERGPRWGLASAAGAALVMPLQWLRGWAWGGTLEANAVGGLSESLAAAAWAVAHALYTFLKTAFWLGGWSFFRAPHWFLYLVASVTLVAVATSLTLRRPPERLGAHVVGLIAASVGFVVFALGQRAVFGVWGGVGGWYFWGWLPWLALAARDFFIVRPGRHSRLLTAALALCFLSTVIWFGVAIRVYGL